MPTRAAALATIVCLACIGCSTPPQPPAPPEAGCAARPPACCTIPPAPTPPACVQPTAPTPITPEPPSKALTEESFPQFAQLLVGGLARGEYERHCLSPAEVERIFAPNIAPIIQTGRTAWVSSLQGRLTGKVLSYKSVGKGPDYTFTSAEAASGQGEKVPQVTDLRIEITANGNPLTIFIRKMYGIGADWKILKAEVFE